MSEIVFWGASGQAKVLKEALSRTDFRLVALVDNREVNSPFSGVPVLKGVTGLDAWLDQRGGGKDMFAAVAIGGAHGGNRIELMDLMRERGLNLLTIIHRNAFVAADAQLGEGCQVMAQAAICTHVKLGSGVIVNTGALIDHDCVIGSGAHIGPGSRLAGEVEVGTRAFIGVGAIVLPRIHIGEDAVVGAGAVVTKNVQPGSTVIGNPARNYRI